MVTTEFSSTSGMGNLSAAEMLELNALKEAQSNGTIYSTMNSGNLYSSTEMSLTEAEAQALRLASEAHRAETIRLENAALSAEQIARIEATQMSVLASEEAMTIQREEEGKALLAAQMAAEAAR
jgi:hypothetical protein